MCLGFFMIRLFEKVVDFEGRVNELNWALDYFHIWGCTTKQTNKQRLEIE